MNLKILGLIFAVFLSFQFMLTGHILADEKAVEKNQKSDEKPRFIGFVDKNKDGINDLFHDADGDGVNDVNKEKYEHRFEFQDKNKDKVNDIFIDKDGDGVNDLETKFADKDKDGINDNVLDYNKDSINDITGLKYEKKDLMGYRYGIVEEEAKKSHKKFIDEDGDGMNDSVAKRRGIKNNTHDRFIDNDNDGISDDRQLGLRRRQGRGPMQRGRARRGKQ